MHRPVRILFFFLIFSFLSICSTASAESEIEPFINPLADISAYSKADFRHNQKWNFRYRNAEGNTLEKQVVGEIWDLVLSKDAAGTPENLEGFLPDQNTVAYTRSGNELFFKVLKSKAEIWWVTIEDAGKNYRISQVRETRLNPGETLRYSLGGDAVNEVSFSSFAPLNRAKR